MRSSRDILPIQKVAAVFIITGAVMTLLRIFKFIETSGPWYEDLAAGVSLIGFILYLFPYHVKRFKKNQPR